MATCKVQVRLMFGTVVKGCGGSLVDRQIEVQADGSDTLLSVKEKIAVGTILPDDHTGPKLCKACT